MDAFPQGHINLISKQLLGALGHSAHRGRCSLGDSLPGQRMPDLPCLPWLTHTNWEDSGRASAWSGLNKYCCLLESVHVTHPWYWIFIPLSSNLNWILSVSLGYNIKLALPHRNVCVCACVCVCVCLSVYMCGECVSALCLCSAIDTKIYYASLTLVTVSLHIYIRHDQ